MMLVQITYMATSMAIPVHGNFLTHVRTVRGTVIRVHAGTELARVADKARTAENSGRAKVILATSESAFQLANHAQRKNVSHK